MQRELRAVQRLANETGVSMRNSLSGGGGAHSGSSGIIRESIVLFRELSAGNFTKVPGSISILLQRMGILKFILKDTASAAQVLAAAWEAQAQTASLAAIAATRKAAASSAALYAEGGETEATLASAVADEEKAAAAILAAKATQAKAVAAGEAAAAEGVLAGATLGVGAMILGVFVGIAAGAYAAYKFSTALVERLSGLKIPDFHPEYIAKHLQSVNAAVEGQKQINIEIEKSVALYNSAAKSAERVADATKEHFDHLEKMNSYEQDPVKKAARQLEILKERHNQELANKFTDKSNLELEAKGNKAQADAIQVSSKEHDENLIKQKKDQADKAQEYLDKSSEAKGGFKDTLIRGYNSVALSGVSGNDLDAAEKTNRIEANRRIQAYHETVNQAADNEDLRKRKAELEKRSRDAATRAAVIGVSIKDQKVKDAQSEQDLLEDQEAAANAQKHKMGHGSVNSLQQIGAYASPASSELVSVAHKQLHHLKGIHDKISKIGGGGGHSFGKPGF